MWCPLRTFAAFLLATLSVSCAGPRQPVPPVGEMTDGAGSARAEEPPQAADASTVPPASAPPPPAGMHGPAGSTGGAPRWGDAKIIDAISGYENADILRAESTKHRGVDACMERVVRGRRELRATTTFQLKIDGKGKLSSIARGRDDLGDSVYVECIERVLRSVSWPRPKVTSGGSVTLSYLLIITPPDPK